MLRKGKKNVVEVVSYSTGSNLMILRDQNGTEYEVVLKEVNGKPITWVPNWYPLNYLKEYEIDGEQIVKVGKELDSYDVEIPFYDYVEEIIEEIIY